jgi:hypothetical protein
MPADQRTRYGWLTADALRAGGRDQYAVTRSYGTFIVELTRDDAAGLKHGKPWKVAWHVTDPGAAEPAYGGQQFFAEVEGARRKFRTLQRQHP